MLPHIVGLHNKKRLGCAMLSYLCYFRITPICHSGERHAELFSFALCTVSPGSTSFPPTPVKDLLLCGHCCQLIENKWCCPSSCPGQELNLQLFLGDCFTETLCHTEHVTRHMAQSLSQTEAWFPAQKSIRKTEMYRAVTQKLEI